MGWSYISTNIPATNYIYPSKLTAEDVCAQILRPKTIRIMSSPFLSTLTYAAYVIAETSLGPRDHHYIFIETHEQGPMTGHRFHVIGNIQEEMVFNHRFCGKPDDEPVFLSKVRIGAVRIDDYESGRFLSVFQEIEVPKKQFQGAKKLFPEEKLRRCQEWAGEAVALLKERVLLR